MLKIEVTSYAKSRMRGKLIRVLRLRKVRFPAQISKKNRLVRGNERTRRRCKRLCAKLLERICTENIVLLCREPAVSGNQPRKMPTKVIGKLTWEKPVLADVDPGPITDAPTDPPQRLIEGKTRHEAVAKIRPARRRAQQCIVVKPHAGGDRHYEYVGWTELAAWYSGGHLPSS